MPTLIDLSASPIANASDPSHTIQAGDDLDQLATQFLASDRLAIRFEHFTDGRGYSIARDLRQLYGFKGALRAVGDITVDQLPYLARCGFTEFLLRSGQDQKNAFGSLHAFSVGYQKSHPITFKKVAISP
jgi:uncharacterized protein (DUF934 family)